MQRILAANDECILIPATTLHFVACALRKSKLGPAKDWYPQKPCSFPLIRDAS